MAPFSMSPYQPAANLLNRMWSEGIGIKSLAYDKMGNLTCSKSTYAQVHKVLQHQHVLKGLLERVPVTATNQGLLYVLLFELLLGPNQAIKGGGSLKRQLVEKLNAFQKVLKREYPKVHAQAASQTKAARVTLPRYLRINTLQAASSKEVIEQLQDLLSTGNDNSDAVQLYADPHVPDLMVVDPAATGKLMMLLQQQQSDEISQTLAGKLVLQDKSSCFSALCLMHGFGPEHDNYILTGDIIDATAAPGNKTQHIAALVAAAKAGVVTKKKGRQTTTTVHALDRDARRLASLERRMKELVPAETADTGSKKKQAPRVQVVAQCTDFLETKPSDYATVNAILLDPSCSGSGRPGGDKAVMEQKDDDEHDDAGITNPDEQDRVAKLAHFQVKALTHAMSFPSVQRIVYSTCSIHVEENEAVVAKVLATDSDSEWEVVSPRCLQDWPRRGQVLGDNVDDDSEHSPRLTESQAAAMIRVHAATDETHGFFVCCLQRKPRKASPNKNKGATRPPVTPPALLTSLLPVYVAGTFASVSTTTTKASSTKRKEAPSKEEDDDTTRQSDTPPPKMKKKKVKKDPAVVAETMAKHGNKVAKKLAWKQRQQLQRQERIKNTKKLIVGE